MKVFVPFSEDLMEKLGMSMDDLVPFDLEYEILRPEQAFDELPDARTAAELAPAH